MSKNNKCIKSSEMQGAVKAIIEALNRILKRVKTASNLKDSIENLIQCESEELLEESHRLFISQLNAKKGGQGAFHVEFYQEEKEIQSPIAKGSFLKRKIYLKGHLKITYVEEELLPLLRELFEKLDFEIVESEGELYD